MNSVDLYSMLPMLILIGASIVIMMGISWKRHHAMTFGMTLVGFAAAFSSFCCLETSGTKVSHAVAEMLLLDSYSYFFMKLILVIAFIVTVFSYYYLEQMKAQEKFEPELDAVHLEEFYLSLVLATIGAMVMVASSHFISFFLGLELLTIPLYALIAYHSDYEPALEAGTKYLILAGASSAFLLFGMALIYSQTGTMSFVALASGMATNFAANTAPTLPLMAGMALMMVGIGFKLSLVPFHMWAPDIYQGAPAPVSGFVACVSKGAVIALVARYFFMLKLEHYPVLQTMLTCLAVASMLLGNILALLQNNIKRLLAYSSTAHLGYLILPLIVGTPAAFDSILFYTVGYTLTLLAAFCLISVFSDLKEKDFAKRDTVATYRGLFWTRPFLACLFTMVMLSLVGIPLTVGFMGKYFIIANSYTSGLWPLVLVLVLSSIIGLYYYLKIIVSMFASGEDEEHGHDSHAGGHASHGHDDLAPANYITANSPAVPMGANAILGLLFLVIVGLGLFPSCLLNIIQNVRLDLW